MEIPTPQPDGTETLVMPPEYEEFASRRMLWQEFGLHYDDTPLVEIAQAMTFRALERKHPRRFQEKPTDGKN